MPFTLFIFPILLPCFSYIYQITHQPLLYSEFEWIRMFWWKKYDICLMWWVGKMCCRPWWGGVWTLMEWSIEWKRDETRGHIAYSLFAPLLFWPPPTLRLFTNKIRFIASRNSAWGMSTIHGWLPLSLLLPTWCPARARAHPWLKPTILLKLHEKVTIL